MALEKLKEEENSKTKKPIKIFNPVVGYTGFNRMVASGNVYQKDYQKSRADGFNLVRSNLKKSGKKFLKRGSSLSAKISTSSKKSVSSRKRKYGKFLIF